LQFARISVDAGIVTLNWSALPAHSYRVQFKDNLEAPAWTPLGEEVLAGGVTASITDVVPPTAHRFYRVLRSD